MIRLQNLLIKSAGFGLNLLSLFAPEYAAQKALTLFATPPKPRVRAKEQAFLGTARQLRRQSAGREIVEYHWGEGAGRPLIVLTYGWGYNAGRWRHFVPGLLDAGFRVIAYDPPGHGLAPTGQLTMPLNAAILTDLIHTYGPAEAILGHSFGGTSSVYAVEGLPRHLWPQRMAVMASFSYVPHVFSDYRRMLGLWPTLYWRLVRRSERVIGAPLDAFDLARISGGLGEVDALLVHDPADRVTRFAETRRYHAYWPGSLLLRARGAGHHLGHPEITAAVLEFVTRGKAPAAAERQDEPLAAGHELVRYFAGM